MQIQINNLKKCFGEKVAVNIDTYTIHSGEMLGLVGNNGAGKSTLFRLILDLIKADNGDVHMAGNFQETDVDVNVAETEQWKDWTGAYIGGISSDELKTFLDRFSHFMADEVIGQKKLIRNLSAGNKQKVGIIAAMLLRPQVLILDEPFNFLDPSSQSAIKHLLTKYNQETGATILISSHNLQHTVDICPRIALLEHGIIIRDIDNRDGQAQTELEDYFQITD